MGKLVLLQKFCVTATVSSRLSTTCHHPPGTNTVSPGFCRISICRKHKAKKKKHFSNFRRISTLTTRTTYRLTIARPIGQFCFWINSLKPGDGFVTLFAAHRAGYFQQFFGRVRGKETPTLVAKDQCVPGARTQRINMNAGTGASRSHDKPSIRWSTIFTAILKQIVQKIFGHRIIFEQLLPTIMLKKRKKNSIFYYLLCRENYALTSPKPLSKMYSGLSSFVCRMYST